MAYDFSNSNRFTRMPAWLASVVFHILLLLVLSLLMLGADPPVSQEEPTRPVGIVLTQHSETLDRQYFDETSVDETREDSSSDSATNNLPQKGAPLEAASLALPELTLPRSSNIPLPGITSVGRPRLSVTNGRPKLPGIDESAIIAAEQEKLRASQARGPTASLGVFGSQKAVGGSFVFLIDRSQSMGGSGLGVLRDAEEELVRSLQQLNGKHRFQVAVYHNKNVYLQRRELLPATDANKELVPGFLGSKAAFGSTEHERALMSVLSLEPDVIFLLTDGGEPKLTTQQIRAIAKIAGSRTSIHCIQFGSGPLRDSDNFLSRLAAATGGGYGYIDVRQRNE